MPLPATLSLNRLIDCLKVNYSLDVKSLTPLSGGADIEASLYRAQTKDQSYFVKLKRGYENNFSFTLLDLLRDSGIQEIIPPIKNIYGSPLQRIDDYSLILFPFFEGVNGFNQKLGEKQWETLGKALRKVHRFNVPPELLKHIRKETYSPKWRQQVRSFYANFPIKSVDKDEIALKFLSLMKEQKKIIEHLLNRAEELSFAVKEMPEKFVLCHSDIHGGNVIIKECGTIHIIDWDDPIMAPKERDLMFIGGGVANVWNDPREEDYFYKGYGKTEINRSLLTYYRYERIVQDLAEFIEILFLDIAHNDRVKMLDHFIGIFDPNGVVDIAFKTDREA